MLWSFCVVDELTPRPLCRLVMFLSPLILAIEGIVDVAVVNPLVVVVVNSDECTYLFHVINTLQVVERH
jgi:hypothetical protein